MKTFFEKISARVAAIVVLLVGAVMAGLGLTVIALLAMFGLAVAGLAFVVAPFVAHAVKQAEEGETVEGEATFTTA